MPTDLLATTPQPIDLLAGSSNMDTQVTPDRSVLSWRQGQPSTTWEDFKNYFVKDAEVEKAKATNALTYSEMLNISPSTAYKYHDEISQQVKDRMSTEPITTQAVGMGKAIKTGLDTSLVGMMSRQKVPEPFDSVDQWERSAHNLAAMIPDIPFMIAGMALGGGPTTLSGWGGAFALPMGLRQVLVDKYSKGDVKDFPDFMDRFGNAMRETVKGEIVGGFTGMAGRFTPAGWKALSEYSTMTVAGKMIEGQVPTAQDFMDNAAMLVGMHVLGKAGGKVSEALPEVRTRLMDMFVKTGIDPREVVQEVKNRIPADQLSNPDPKMVMDALDQVQQEAEVKTAELQPTPKVEPTPPEIVQPGATSEATPTEIRPIKDIFADLNTAIGEKGAIGDQEPTPEQKSARERLNTDIEILKTNAKKAGQQLGDYAKSLGWDDTQVEKLVKFVGQNEEPKKETPTVKPTMQTVVDGLQKAYDKARDLWSGDKDVRSLEAMAEKANFQDQLKSALGLEKYTQRAKDTENAIRIYLDIKIDPEKFTQENMNILKEKYPDTYEERQRAFDIAKTIDSNPALKAIADKVALTYSTEGQRAMDAGKINSLINEGFAARYWDLGDEKRLSNFFKTKTGHAEERTFPTLMDGWLAGYNENIKGAFNGLEIYRNEVSRTIANQEFKDQMINTVDENGKPLLSKEPMKGYKPLQNPQFFGTYAPADIADKLNNVIGTSWIREHAVPNTILKYAMTAKAWILQTSLFHPRAFLNSYFLGGHPSDWGTFSPVEAAHQGRDMIKQLNPTLVTLRKNGLTFGLISDWDEKMFQQQTIVGDMIDKMGYGDVKDKVLELQKAQADWLFGSFGAGLKVFDAVHRFGDELKRYPDSDPDAIAKRVAEAVNLNYGGLHLERMQRDKTLQDIFHLAVLAPDWTESNLRLTAKALKGVATGSPEELAVYQKLVLGWAIKSLGFTAICNFVMAGGNADDMMDNYEKAWEAGNLKWLQMNITPLYKMFGGETSNTKYYQLIGHMLDPVKALVTPFQFIRNKASVPSKLLIEAVTGADWQGKSFATVGELYDKGKLTRFGPGKAVKWDTLPAYALSQMIGIQPIPFQNFINYAVGQTEGFDAIANTLGVGVTTGYTKRR
jgi:hypothetical protein